MVLSEAMISKYFWLLNPLYKWNLIRNQTFEIPWSRIAQLIFEGCPRPLTPLWHTRCWEAQPKTTLLIIKQVKWKPIWHLIDFKYCSDFKVLIGGKELYITREELMDLVDYDMKEAIGSE